MATHFALVLLIPFSFGCPSEPNPVSDPVELNQPAKLTVGPKNRLQAIIPNAAQKAEIRQLLELLVFANRDATKQPVISPGITDDSKEYRKRFESCQKAFEKLSEFKGLAFPILIEHLDDKRQSINFRNHHIGNSVGDACYWNIYLQLQDTPRDYSQYGYSRKGRDGKNHPKPYWEDTPFDDAGGLRKWLKENKDLSYLEMQIKCLKWLLDKEKRIGASDADSYFVNILPLEIRILERRKENGENVDSELHHLQKRRDEKLVADIPQELLPER